MKIVFALLAISAWNSPITGEFPAQRPAMRSFDVFFDLRLINRLSKQSRGWWLETPPRPYDVTVMSSGISDHKWLYVEHFEIFRIASTL